MRARQTIAALAAALLAPLAACGQEAAVSPSEPPADSGMDVPGFAPAERALEMALADVGAIADNAALLEAGAIDEGELVTRLRAIQARIETLRPDWRGASAEARASARVSLANALEAATARRLDAVAAFQARPPPRSARAALLLEDDPLAEFLREPPVEVFSGVFRSGFEASDFHSLDGGGPWWALFDDEAAWEQVRAAGPAQGGGRGSFITVALEVEGWLEDVPDDRYDYLGGRDAELHVETVRSVRGLSSEEYQEVLGAIAAVQAGGE